MKAAIYVRFATKEQAEQSIAIQVNACQDYAQANGYEVTDKYIDIVSGMNANRPQFQKMFDDSKSQAWDAVLVYRLDRFSRSASDFAHCKEVLKEHNIRLISVTEPEHEGSLIELITKLMEGKP